MRGSSNARAAPDFTHEASRGTSKLTLKNGGGQPKPYTLIYPNTCPLDGGMLRNDTLMLKTCETATAGRNHIGWLILILLVAVAIHATGSFWIGYISDDYDLLQRAPSVSISDLMKGITIHRL
jgi:hypothetical protein